MIDRIHSLFLERFGAPPVSIEPLRADGSNRRIWRVSDEQRSVIAFHGPDALENRAFLSFTESFRSIGLPVPEIFASDLDAGVYLEEDLGNVTLLRALESSRADGAITERVVALFRRSLELLARFQVEGGRVVNFRDAYPVAEFDRRGIMWDLNYFKYDYLKPAGIDFHEARLEEDFEALAEFLLRADRSHFLYRDFNPRNIMIRGDEPWFIDYQGGRRGAVHYDVASLLFSSKAALAPQLRDELRDHYVAALSSMIDVDQGEFNEMYNGYVLLRILQLLGAYGFRGYFERKQHFIDSVPYAIENIRMILGANAIPLELPELRATLNRIIESEAARAATPAADTAQTATPAADTAKTATPAAGAATTATPAAGAAKTATPAADTAREVVPPASPRNTGGLGSGATGSAPPPAPQRADIADQSGRPESILRPGEVRDGGSDPAPDAAPPLTVTVRSFSFKKGGYPEEPGSHGGGFVFDVRALHNPGRYDEYKALSGLDAPVVTFLEQEAAVESFFESVWNLVSGAVQAYLERGFDSLSVSFGCTGGQHRSVYFAERLVRTLREAFPSVIVQVSHRESQRWPRSSTADSTAAS